MKDCRRDVVADAELLETEGMVLIGTCVGFIPEAIIMLVIGVSMCL